MLYGEGIAILNRNFKPVQGFGPFVGTSYATPVAAGTAALVLELLRSLKKDCKKDEENMRRYCGMSGIFKAMCGRGPNSEGYYHVMPWKLLGEPTRNNNNQTQQGFTLDRVLSCLASVVGPPVELLSHR